VTKRTAWQCAQGCVLDIFQRNADVTFVAAVCVGWVWWCGETVSDAMKADYPAIISFVGIKVTSYGNTFTHTLSPLTILSFHVSPSWRQSSRETKRLLDCCVLGNPHPWIQLRIASWLEQLLLLHYCLCAWYLCLFQYRLSGKIL
jgi:hypothetical protein